MSNGKKTVKKKTARKSSANSKPKTRTRVSKKLYREVSIKKLIELFGKEGTVLCSANQVEQRQMEILKDKAQMELDL